MVDLKTLRPTYVTDEHGARTAVILPLQEFEELLEDIADLAVLAERRDEPTIPHEEAMKELSQDDHLPD